MKNIRVFISYSHEDTKIVVPIVSIIKVMSNKVFRDVEDIKPGDKWEIKIENALEQCEKIMLFWCSHSAKSPYVIHEYTSALKSGKTLIPILLDATPVPKNISRYQWIDLKEISQTLHDDKVRLHAKKRQRLWADFEKEQEKIMATIYSNRSAIDALHQLTLRVLNMSDSF